MTTSALYIISESAGRLQPPHRLCANRHVWTLSGSYIETRSTPTIAMSRACRGQLRTVRKRDLFANSTFGRDVRKVSCENELNIAQQGVPTVIRPKRATAWQESLILLDEVALYVRGSTGEIELKMAVPIWPILVPVSTCCSRRFRKSQISAVKCGDGEQAVRGADKPQPVRQRFSEAANRVHPFRRDVL